MKKIILFLILFVLVIPSLAYAKVNFGSELSLRGANKKYISNFISFGIYNYKKFANIQKAIHSSKNYMFFITDIMAKPLRAVNCATASVFVTNKYNTSKYWSAYISLCETDSKLRSTKGSVSAGLKHMNIFLIAHILKDVNKYYNIWKR